MVTPKNKPSMAASLLVAFPVFFPFFSSATLSASANLLKSKNALSLSSAHQVLYLGLSYHRLVLLFVGVAIFIGLCFIVTGSDGSPVANSVSKKNKLQKKRIVS
jgi:hypothetical protein